MFWQLIRSCASSPFKPIHTDDVRTWWCSHQTTRHTHTQFTDHLPLSATVRSTSNSMFQYRKRQVQKIPFRFKAKQSKAITNSTDTMPMTVVRRATILLNAEVCHQPRPKAVHESKSHCHPFAMENHRNSAGFSACVLCSSNFTDNDVDNIVTTCGHQYHKLCLFKWFASSKE